MAVRGAAASSSDGSMAATFDAEIVGGGLRRAAALARPLYPFVTWPTLMWAGIGFGGCQADRLPGPVRFWLPRRISLVGGAVSSRMMPTVLSCLVLKRSSRKPNRPLALVAMTVRRHPPARWWTFGATLHGYRAGGRARGGPNLEWPVRCHWR